jgi:uncharacterized membrane protein
MSPLRLLQLLGWVSIVGCSRSGPAESSEPSPVPHATPAPQVAPALEAAPSPRVAPPAQANSAQPLYRVVGVASDDTLALRAEPSAVAEQLGEIPAGSMGIAAWGEDRRVDESTWRPIEHGGRRGWVNARYLTADTPPGGPLPRALRCVGTEPFWALTLEPGAPAKFEEPGGEPFADLTTLAATPAGAERWTIGVERGAPGQGSKRAMTASVARSRKCSDGMSDGIYEYDVSVAVDDGRKLLGCCRDSRDMIR